MRSTSACVLSDTPVAKPPLVCACGKLVTIIMRGKPLCAGCFKALAVGRGKA